MRQTVTIQANSYITVNMPMEVEEGYTPSFLTGYALNNLNVVLYNFYLDTNTMNAVLGIKNTSSSTQTVTIMVNGSAEKNFIY